MTHSFRCYHFDPIDVEGVLSTFWKQLFNEYNFPGDVYYTHKWGKGHFITFVKYDAWSEGEVGRVEHVLGKGVGAWKFHEAYQGWQVR